MVSYLGQGSRCLEQLPPVLWVTDADLPQVLLFHHIRPLKAREMDVSTLLSWALVEASMAPHQILLLYPRHRGVQRARAPSDKSA